MSNFNSSHINNIDGKLNNTYSKGIDIYASDVRQKISDNGSKSFNVTFENGSDTNIYYSSLTPDKYTAKRVYLYGILHNNITGMTDSNQCIGELVIEHTNNSSFNNKVYTCYLLKASDSNSGGITNFKTESPYSIDDYINFLLNYDAKDSNKVNLLTGVRFDDIIGNTNQNNNKNQYIYYKDTKNNNNSIIIYLTPITVINNTNITNVSKLSSYTDLFSINAPLQPTPIINSNSAINANNPNSSSNTTLSNSNSDIYIDCSPTGYSKTEIETYNIPINSDILGNKQQMDIIKICIYFLIFIFIIFILFFSVPYFYKKVVIDATNKFSKNADIDILTRIRSIDIWISMFVLYFCYLLFSEGFNNNNSNSLMIGLFLFIIFGVSVSLIQYNKSESDYMKTIVNNCSIGNVYNINDEFLKHLSIVDIFDTIKYGFLYYFKDVFKLHMALVIICSIVTFIYFLILGKDIDSKFFDIVSYYITIFFPISFIIQIFIS